MQGLDRLIDVSGIPTDNHVRNMLDPVSPDACHPVFGTVLEEIDQAERLAPLRRLGGHKLIALDGTEYFTSSKIEGTIFRVSIRLVEPTDAGRQARSRDRSPLRPQYLPAVRPAANPRAIGGRTSSEAALAGRAGHR